jgi:vacuolar-type H+-ATPase subunit I/STV1
MEPSSGLSLRRERFWGLIGGIVGSIVGSGGFLIAWLIQNEAWGDMVTSPYPVFFRRREMMPLDFYFLALVFAGLLFMLIALIHIRSGAYPRTDGFGAALVGTILSALGGVILFLRLWAVLH